MYAQKVFAREKKIHTLCNNQSKEYCISSNIFELYNVWIYPGQNTMPFTCFQIAITRLQHETKSMNKVPLDSFSGTAYQ